MTASPGPDTARAAETLTRCIRCLNHATGPGAGGLREPADLYDLLGWLHLAAGGLPQLTRQLARWLDQHAQTGTLRDDRGRHPAGPATAASQQLQQAAETASQLTRALQTAQNHIATLAPATPVINNP